MTMSKSKFNEIMKEVNKSESTYNYMDAPFLPSDIFNHCFEVKENPITTLRVLEGEKFDKILLEKLTSKFNPDRNEVIREWLVDFIKQFNERYQDE